tara:strand:+ start:223 stop:528 length:306 start_codon:yes stop_codon:yes gene_type:complete
MVLTKKQAKYFQMEKIELVNKLIAVEKFANEIGKHSVDNNHLDMVKALEQSIGLDGLNHMLQDKFEKVEILLDKVWSEMINDREFRLEMTTLFANKGGKDA